MNWFRKNPKFNGTDTVKTVLKCLLCNRKLQKSLVNNVLFPAGNFEVSTVVLFKNVGQEEKYSGKLLIIEVV